MNRMMSTWRSVMLCVLTLLALSGCNERESFPGSGGGEVVSIALEMTGEASVPVGLNGRVIATATYDDDSKKNISSDVSWVLDNTNFTENGLTNDNEQRFKASSVSPGASTTIKAVMGDIESDAVTLTVSEATVVALKVTPTQATIPAGLSEQFYASAVLSDNRVLDVTSDDVVSWTMGDQSIEQGLATPSAESVGQSLPISVSGSAGGQTFSDEATLNVSDLTVSRVEVQPVDGEVWNTDLAVGASREVVAIATMSNNTTQPLNNQDVIWSPVADSGVVMVEEEGDSAYTKGLKAGVGEVTATLKNAAEAGAFSFNVFEQIDAKAGIVGTEDSLRKGASMHLKFVSEGSDGRIADLTGSTTWALNDTTYAHMEGNALIATPQGGYNPALDYSKAGTVTVTATNGALKDTYDVTLLDATATMLSISPSIATTVAYGNNLQMEARLTYSDGFQENVTDNPSMYWNTSEGALASFSNKTPGLLVTGEPEMLTVSGRFEGVDMTPSTEVTVNNKIPTSLSLSPTSGYSAGLPQQLTVTMVYDDGTPEKLAFDDADLSVVVTEWDGDAADTPVITADGVFYAPEPGKVTLTATKSLGVGGDITTTETFDVTPAKLISSLALSPKEAELASGQSQTFEAYSIDVEGNATLLDSSQVTFTLDDDGTGSTLDPDTGKVTAGPSAGDATLTATMKNVSPDDTVDGQIPTQSANIAVVAKTLESIEVQLPENLTLIPGQKVALSALGRYNDDSAAVLSNDSVTWSKDPAITAAFELIDNDGDTYIDTLQAVKAGSGSVKATSSGITDTSGLITVDNATITDMVISPDIDELPVGFSQTFEAFAVADTGANAKLDGTQVSWDVTPKVGVSGTNNGDGTYTVESNSDGVTVTVTASLKAGAFPDVGGNDLSKEETFTTVPADITNLVVEPLDASTVVVGVPYRLRAEAVQNNGELFDATDKVTWTSDDSTVDINGIDKTVTFLESGNDTVTLTATPNDAASFGDYATPAMSTVTVLKPEVQGIIVTPPEKTIGTEESTELQAYAYYSYGKEPLDVTESVTWSVELAEGESDTYGVTVIETGAGAGTVTSSTQTGVVKVTATDGAGNSNSSVVTIELLLPMCGSGVDDTDQTNAKGACLKVASDSAGNWFTSTPSLAVMELLEYEEEDLNTNSGDTYARTSTETGSYGPIDGVFAQFRQDGNGVVNPGNGDDANAGVDGQFDRWCQKLASLNFAGKNDWHRPTKNELSGLYNDVGDSLWDARGWPTYYRYWSATVIGSHYSYVSLIDGYVYSSGPSSEHYASCVSNP
ncbi:conserved exported hypothetical protein [Vibrio owensii]|uniref:hypothetical protein n=1 Tax=Vibrio owensii TaxID=696485 RepID=UPI002893E581|nr:conserved exported hypothetical protein [Vibrio owensii]CAH1585510.1 conserved exported hypothetical protein [Vibrio owensii]